MAAPAPSPHDETITGTFGGNDVTNNKEDTQNFILLKLLSIPMFLLG